MAKATEKKMPNPLLAYVGATDLAVEKVRGFVTTTQATAQERFAALQEDVKGFDFKPQALRDQAVTVVNARVESLSKDAKARREAIEARVAELQKQAQTVLVKNVNGTYDELVVRGEKLVRRVRRQKSTQDTVKSAKTTSAKAKTTKTQGEKKASTAKTATKQAAKKTAAKKTGAKSSAKATATAAKKTASSAAKATTDAASKVGD